MIQLSISDTYERVVALIASHNGSRIPVPELARLLGVKATTLNARFRRTHISVSVVGRTNYVPSDTAMDLAAHHKYALMGWPTLQKASRLIGVKSGTLKARCEKGQLEGHLDLTKRLRINPISLEHVSLSRRKKSPSENGVCLEGDHDPAPLPPPAPPEIRILRAADYGLPEPAIPSQPNGRSSKLPASEPKRNGYLNYNPDEMFSVSECMVGRTIRYGSYKGTIVKILDDPFSPRIKVYFPEHPHPLMSEVLLAVGKRNG